MTSLADQFDSIPTGQGASSAPAAPSNAPPDYSSILQTAGQKYNVDPKLLGAMLQTESSGKPGAVSNKGATGLMQIEPSNYKALGITDPTNPTQNIMGGAKLMSQLLDRYGDVPTALTHYVGGDDQSKWGPQTRAYPARVLSNYGAPQVSGAQQQPQGSTAPQPARASSLADQFDATPTQPAAAPPTQTQQPGAMTRFGRMAAGAIDTFAGIPGQVAQSANYAVRRALGSSPEQAAQDSANYFGGSANPIGNYFGVTNTPEYQGEVSQRAQQAVGGAVGKGVNAVASATGLPQQDVANMANSLSALVVPAAKHLAIPVAGVAANELGYAGAAAAAGARKVGGAIGEAAGDIARGTAQTARDFGNAVGTATGIKAPEAPSTNFGPPEAAAAAAGTAGRGSVGAAGTSFAEQARAEGVPPEIVQRIAAAEQAGTLNPTAAARHIEAGSLSIPVDLTEGMASGDDVKFSNEMNSRGKNPDYVYRLNQINNQLVDNLTDLRDRVSPNVNVEPGAPMGQAIVDAYKEMDEPIRHQISDNYAAARSADGAPALVNAAPQMQNVAAEIGPTRFAALPANVQQIFRNALANQTELPPGFEVNGSNVRPMNVSDLMDIDKTLSGAANSATDGSVRHDIGVLRDAIINSDLNPSGAGADAFQAYNVARASARARFTAMDNDPAYKAAVNDIARVGEPSPLADDFTKKYIANGKTSNVANMMQNLSNDPINRELVGSALVDHVRQRAGIDLRNDTGNLSQDTLNKTLQNLGRKTQIVLGPEAAQNLEKIGNVARYTQKQGRGAFVNNSNSGVAIIAEAAKSGLEGAVNVKAGGVPVATWARQAFQRRADAQALSRTLEPGAGLTSEPLNRLVNRTRGNQ